MSTASAPCPQPTGFPSRPATDAFGHSTSVALCWSRDTPEPERCTGAIEELVERVTQKDELVWIDLCAPDADRLRLVADELQIPEAAIEDVVAPHERPKATRHDDRAAFVVYALTRRTLSGESALAGADEKPAGASSLVHSRLFHRTRVCAFVLPTALVTIRSDDNFDMDRVVQRWSELGVDADRGSFALAHGLLDVVVDDYFGAVQEMDDRIESLEDELFEPTWLPRVFQEQAYGLRRELVSLRRDVLPVREVIQGVWRHRDTERGRLDLDFADLMDHVLRVGEWTDSLREMLGTVFETHLSLQDQRLNQVMKKLAGWAAVISIPTMVTGWFGMNVPYPGKDQMLGVILAAVATVLPAVGIWWGMRRAGWL